MTRSSCSLRPLRGWPEPANRNFSGRVCAGWRTSSYPPGSTRTGSPLCSSGSPSPLLTRLPRGSGRRSQPSYDWPLAWSSRAEELAPSFASALTLGFAHLHLDQLDEAIGAWRKAMARDPSNLELPVQLAWELAACDRLEDALVFVDRVLAVDPSYNAASMAAQAFRYHRDKDIQHLLVIADRVRESPGDLDASNALAGICRGIPWFGVVPEPTEAIINVLKRALAELEPDSEIASLTLSALEAPSAVLTLRGAFPRIDLTVESIPAPDMRTPLREITYRVWDYDGAV